MRRNLMLGLGLVAVSLGAAASATAVPICLLTSEYCGTPHLNATFGTHVSPMKLPAHEYAPVRWRLFGKIGTSDGSHPPALREIELDVDKDVRLNAKGYPACRASGRERRDPGAMMAACRAAVLGKGGARVEVAFPEQEPILVKSPLTVFNGGESRGKAKLLIQIIVTVPVPTAVVTEVTIIRRATGVHTVSKVPTIAGGNGSLIDFKFKLGKTFSYKGKSVGYFEAKCPDEVFKVNAKKLLFKNEAQTPGEAASTSLKDSLTVPCTTGR
jgi:hypothetical protein